MFMVMHLFFFAVTSIILDRQSTNRLYMSPSSLIFLFVCTAELFYVLTAENDVRGAEIHRTFLCFLNCSPFAFQETNNYHRG